MNGTWMQAMNRTEIKAMFQEGQVEHLELVLKVKTEQNNRLVLSRN